MTQNRSAAVMGQRAPAIVEADDAERARWRALDWFASPPWSSRAGAEMIKGLDPEAQSIWEPACGDGIMAECLAEYFPDVKASDIRTSYDKAFGSVDFLTFATSECQADWIVTNPPFGHAAEFVLKGLQLARRGVAVLCRLAFLETVDRYKLHFVPPHTLAVLAPFCERVPMQLGPWNPKCSTATAYAWFVYRTDHHGETVVQPIAPGTRARLSKPGDVRRFVNQGDTPPLLKQGRA